jgi:hypothetical protein
MSKATTCTFELITKATILLTISLSVCISAVGAKSESTEACQCPHKNMHDTIDTVLNQESHHDWQKIKWRTNGVLALQEAKAQSKPIFVFFVVKQLSPSPTKWSNQANDTGKT